MVIQGKGQRDRYLMRSAGLLEVWRAKVAPEPAHRVVASREWPDQPMIGRAAETL